MILFVVGIFSTFFMRNLYHSIPELGTRRRHKNASKFDAAAEASLLVDADTFFGGQEKRKEIQSTLRRIKSKRFDLIRITIRSCEVLSAGNFRETIPTMKKIQQRHNHNPLRLFRLIWCTLLFLSCLIERSQAFCCCSRLYPIVRYLPRFTRQNLSLQKEEGAIFPLFQTTAKTATTPKILQSYEHNGYKVTYRFRRSSSSTKPTSKQRAILLIHPVGIGLASWFWDRVLEEWGDDIGDDSYDFYAPNLIGCGIVQDGNDPLDPSLKGMSFPLGWVQGLESLFQSLPQTKYDSWTIVTQGGLATVGVVLAARNPTQIRNLVLCSPPTWKDMITPIPQRELERNFNFLNSPILGRLAFSILESRRAIQFFSDAFLFSQPCDDLWLDNAQKEISVQARPPVMAFNAGFCLHRSLKEELTNLKMPVLVMQGQDDKRARQEYVQEMKNCQLVQLAGTNVMPWESSTEVVATLKKFVASTN